MGFQGVSVVLWRVSEAFRGVPGPFRRVLCDLRGALGVSREFQGVPGALLGVTGAFAVILGAFLGVNPSGDSGVNRSVNLEDLRGILGGFSGYQKISGTCQWIPAGLREHDRE